MTQTQREHYLVVGGEGFLGHHIVHALVARGDSVAVLDLQQRHFDEKRVDFYSADLTKEDEVAAALEKSKPTTIIHTASPVHGLGAAIYHAVNVEGTRHLLAAAPRAGVRKFVFTSSAGTVYDGSNLIDVDERCPYPEVPMDAYNETKAKAEELVLEANGKEGMLTCAIRPAGIFGPGDRQVLAGLLKVVENNQTKFQIGDNTNLFDWTYVENVVHAHLLAADRLASPPVALASIQDPLPPATLSVPSSRIPTSSARPLGPLPTRSASASEEKAALAYATPVVPANDPRPVLRTKFDAFTDILASEETDLDALRVAGQAFFVTNGEPMYFWDFPRAVWAAVGHVPKGRITLPAGVGLALAAAAEAWAWLTGREAGFTRYRVKYSSASRWYNIEKARRVLGYEPQVGVEEGIRRTVEWYQAQQRSKA